MEKISVIVPCYNEEEVLPLFHQEVTKELEKIENVDYEILFIDDGSSDHTISLLKDYVEFVYYYFLQSVY